MSTRSTWKVGCFVTLIAVGAIGCNGADPGQDVSLQNTQQEGKADSVAGKVLTVSFTDDMLADPNHPVSQGCERSGQDPWNCSLIVDGQVDLFVNGNTVGARGNRVIPLGHDSFYSLDPHNQGFGLPNYRDIHYGQLIYARPRGTDAAWSLLSCPGVNYWPGNVLVDLQHRTINDDSDAKVFSIDNCGAPAGDLDISTFVFPISRWFGLQGTYYYTLYVNQP